MAERYTRYFIGKSDGGKRVISAPTPELKERSYKLSDDLNARLEGFGFYDIATPYLHSYIKGRGCTTLANEITDYIADCKAYDIIYLDVKDYFGSIQDHHWNNVYYKLGVLLELDKHGITQELWDNVWDCIYANPADKTSGIAQGNPLSPIVSNLVGWHAIDRQLEKLTKLAECRYWRYSDNIFIAIKRTPGYNRATILDQMLQIAYFNVSEFFKFKWSVKSSNQTNIVLGIRIGKRAQLKDKKWLRSVFHRYAIQGDSLATNEDIINEYGKLDSKGLKQLVDGLAAYVRDVDPNMESYINQKLGVSNGD